VELNIYLCHIVIPGMRIQWGRFAGVRLQDGGQVHKALIGRSMLRNALLVYDGNSGRVTFAC
jgi:hypothetical protein